MFELKTRWGPIYLIPVEVQICLLFMARPQTEAVFTLVAMAI